MSGTLVQQELREGVTKKEFNGIFTKTVDFTDTATPSGLAATDLGNFAMMLKTVRVLFGTPAPNTLTVLIKDKDGQRQRDGEHPTMQRGITWDFNINPEII